MNTQTAALTALAAWLAGGVNALAGGGSFFTFSALVWAGLPPMIANATSATAVSPGYVGSVLAQWQDIRQLPRRDWLLGITVSAIGGVGGAILLMLSSERQFVGVIPFLLGFATLIFAWVWWQQHHPHAHLPSKNYPKTVAPYWGVGVGAIAIYGGYFNGGIGILMMTWFALTYPYSLKVQNAKKNLYSLVLSVTSVFVFVWAGQIDGLLALWMMLWASLGGWMGGHWIKQLNPNAVRGFVVLTGILLTVWFAVRAMHI